MLMYRAFVAPTDIIDYATGNRHEG